MPNRIIREGWIDSFTIDMLDANAERFFLRLCLKADDFGRFHAHPKLLKSALFPLKDCVRDTDMSRDLAVCEKAGLIHCYEASGSRYLVICKFDQRMRAAKSKFPPPPEKCQTDARHVTVTCPPYSESDSESKAKAEPEAGNPPADVRQKPVACQTPDSHLPVKCQTDDGHVTDKCLTSDGHVTVTCPPYSESEAGCPPTETPVELPRGFPKTLEEAITAATSVGCPEDFVKKVWLKAHSRMGRDARDVPIRVWSSYLATEWTYERDRLARDAIKGTGTSQTSSAPQPAGTSCLSGAELVLRQKELERIEDRIRVLGNRNEGVKWPQKDVDEKKSSKPAEPN